MSNSQDELWKNVVLSGGNTCFPGLKSRLKAELEAQASTVEVHASSHRAIAAWSGARKFAELMFDSQLEKWISKESKCHF
jgi:actin-related protein